MEEDKDKRQLFKTVKAKPNCKNCCGHGYVKQFATTKSNPVLSPCTCIVKKYRIQCDIYGNKNVELEARQDEKLQDFVVNIYKS